MKKRIGIVLISVLLIIALCACSSGDDEKVITIGSKDFTDNIVLAHLMADIIEAETDIRVERKVNLGGSNIAWEALKSDEIQLYPEYTGTIVANFYQQETGNSDETLENARNLVAEDGLVLAEPLGPNNTFTLALTKEIVEKYDLKTFSDLAGVASELTLGCEFEFKDRDDGYPGLQEVYGMNFKDVSGMNHGIKYAAIDEGSVDVIDAYATDGQLVVFDLIILEDDKEFFPPYDAVPLVRQDTIDKYPEIRDALNLLGGILDDQTMQTLNAKVDSEGLKAETVAHDFLISKGLIAG